MWPLVKQARYLGRYREIAQVLVGHGFGYLVEQLGLVSLLSLPRRVVLRVPAAPPLGTAARLREALVALGPTFVKLGQAISTRPDLFPPDVVAELGKLQDTVPPFPAAQAMAVVEESLGQPIDQLFAQFDPTPIAAASLGQVHAAQLHTGEHVAVKIQRPEIAARINSDLAIVTDLAAVAQERIPLARQYNLVEMAWEFSATLRAELDYRREGRNADRFRHLFADNPLIRIPKVYWEHTNARVLTTERIYGPKITDMAGLVEAGIDRRELARTSIQLILREIFSFGFFHSDPHPGNFFALPGAVLGMVDFGQVGNLDRQTTQGLILLLAALVDHDTPGALRAMERLSIVARRDVTPRLRHDMQRFTDSLVDRPLSEISARETINELLALLRRHELRMPGPLAVLLKALVMMEGVGLQLDPTLDVFSYARPYVQQALADQFAPTALGAQVARSGRDLAETALELPQQLGTLLERLNAGELLVQSEERELRRVAGALIGAANRIAVGMVLAALILGIAIVAVAVGVGGWTGTAPTVLLVLGGAGVTLALLTLAVALLRGRE
jgi:ubiquinone biosynthesis protein